MKFKEEEVIMTRNEFHEIGERAFKDGECFGLVMGAIIVAFINFVLITLNK